MLANERYNKIMNILENQNSVKVSNLTKLFDVSIETVRRDLEYLEKQGKLKRVYGGAVLEYYEAKNLSVQARSNEGIEQKREIAKIAMKYIKEDQTIGIDSGTTTLETAKMMKSMFKRLTIVTNSLVIANELSNMPYYNIFLTGGMLDNTRDAFIGDIAEQNLQKFRLSIVFLGVSGISISEGITDYFVEQIPIQKAMLNISQQNIILADSNKFGVVGLLKICDFDKVNLIITDSDLKPAVKQKYQKRGIEIANS